MQGYPYIKGNLFFTKVRKEQLKKPVQLSCVWINIIIQKQIQTFDTNI